VLRFWRRRAPNVEPPPRTPCDECPLAACPVGRRVLVTCLGCPAMDAHRLRIMGICEGVRVGIVDTRRGILLDVRGSRLALDRALARSITVRLLAA
jgi:Fe2+ transport system protein FeoA